MTGFVAVAISSFLAASVIIVSLTTSKTLLGVLPLLGHLAVIAQAFHLSLYTPAHRHLCLLLGNSVLLGFTFCLLGIDEIISEVPSRVFATNGVILFCLLMGFQFGTERMGFYSRLTPIQRRWLNGAWLVGITLSLLLYCVYGLQGDLNVLRFCNNLWTAATWN